MQLFGAFYYYQLHIHSKQLIYILKNNLKSYEVKGFNINFLVFEYYRFLLYLV